MTQPKESSFTVDPANINNVFLSMFNSRDIAPSPIGRSDGLLSDAILQIIYLYGDDMKIKLIINNKPVQESEGIYYLEIRRPSLNEYITLPVSEHCFCELLKFGAEEIGEMTREQV